MQPLLFSSFTAGRLGYRICFKTRKHKLSQKHQDQTYTSPDVHDRQCHRSQFRSHQPLLSAPPLSSTLMRLLGCDRYYLCTRGQAAKLKLVQAQVQQQLQNAAVPLHTNSTLVFVMSGAKAVEAYAERHDALT